MSKELTERQEQVLDFIKSQISKLGLPPSHKEISQAIGASSSKAAADHLKALAKKGYIRLHAETSRGIQVLHQDKNKLPLIGSVAAGVPLEAVENIERYITIPNIIAKKKPTYLLRVKGDSMKDAGILDGDLIAIQKTHHAKNGEIIVARIDGDVTVKTLGSYQGKPALLPSNPDYCPIPIDNPQEFRVEGRFVGLIRVH